MTDANVKANVATINSVNPANSVDFRPFLEGISTISKEALLVWIAFVDDHYVVPAIISGSETPCGYILSEKDIRFVKTMLIELYYM